MNFMRGGEMDRERVLTDLSLGLTKWVENGDQEPVKRWLERQLGADGIPAKLGTRDWRRCLAMLAEGRRRAGDWPEGCEERIAEFVTGVLRFSRPDGTMVTGECAEVGRGKHEGLADWAEWAKWYRGTAIGRVLAWWIPRSKQNEDVSPPLPAWSSERAVLSILRADWRLDGDMLAVEHRSGEACSFELRGGGLTWLGPEWEVEELWGAGGRPKRTWWITGSMADRVEWTERAGGVRVTRTAMLMRGRRMALLGTVIQGGAGRGVEVEGTRVTHESRFRIASGVTVAAIENCRGVTLGANGSKVAAQVLPIALPCLTYATERGSLECVEGSIRLRQASGGRRTYLPLLISWDKVRNRKKLSWRVLTVAEKGRIVGPDTAFAARVSWGRDETYVIYRSLAPPAPRTFLGYQTPARFVLGRFNAEGFVEPLVVDV
jgi:hypothetical protein